MNERDAIKTFSFKAQEKLIDKVQERIDKENLKAKSRKDRKNLSKKINELLYDYISR